MNMTRAKQICAAIAAAGFWLMPTPKAAAGAPATLTDNPAATSVDIAGIRIGMSPEQVRTALRAHTPKAELKETQTEIEDYPRSAHVSGILAVVYAGNGAPEEIVAVHFTEPPSAQRVVRVARRVFYRGSNQPSLDATNAALRQKYAEPSFVWTEPYRGTAGKRATWAWTAQGQRKQLARQRDCDLTGVKELMMNDADRGRAAAFGHSTSDDRVLKAGCPFNLTVGFDEESGIVARMDAILADSAMATDGLAITAAHVQALRGDALSKARERADKQRPSL
jgi:hypothetical protein